MPRLSELEFYRDVINEQLNKLYNEHNDENRDLIETLEYCYDMIALKIKLQS